MSVLGEALAIWRTEKGWSQREAANAVDAAPSTWNDWEKGDVRPHPSKLQKIADVFGKPREELDQLYIRAGEEPPAPKSPPMTAEVRMGRMELAIKELAQTVAAAIEELVALRGEVRQLLSVEVSGGDVPESPQSEAPEAPRGAGRSRPSAPPARSRRSSSAQ